MYKVMAVIGILTTGGSMSMSYLDVVEESREIICSSHISHYGKLKAVEKELGWDHLKWEKPNAKVAQCGGSKEIQPVKF